MNSRIDELLKRHNAARPMPFVTLESGVTVSWHPRTSVVEYGGWADVLLETGLVEQKWLKPTGKHLKDQEGDRVTVIRSWRMQDGQPSRYCKVLRYKPTAAAMRLPGASRARTAAEAFDRWCDRREKIVSSIDASLWSNDTSADMSDPEIPLNVQRDVTRLLDKFKRPQA